MSISKIYTKPIQNLKTIYGVVNMKNIVSINNISLAAVDAPGPEPEAGWESIFDDAKWEGWYGEDAPHDTWWNTDRWCCGDYYYEIHLKPKTSTSWATGYRPEKMRITFSTVAAGYGSFGMVLSDSVADVINKYAFLNPASGQEIFLDFSRLGAGDIAELYSYLGDSNCDGNVTNIEFLDGDDPDPILKTINPDSTISYMYWAVNGAATCHECVNEGFEFADDSVTYVYDAYIGQEPLILGLENTDLSTGSYKFNVRIRISGSLGERLYVTLRTGTTDIYTITAVIGNYYTGWQNWESGFSPAISLTASELNDLNIKVQHDSSYGGTDISTIDVQVK